MSAAGAIGGSLQWSECNGSAARTVAGQKITGDESPVVPKTEFPLGSIAAGDTITAASTAAGAADDGPSFGNFITTGSEKRRGKDPITGRQFSAGVQHDRLELVRLFGNSLRKNPAAVFRNQDIVLDTDTDPAIDIWSLLRLGTKIEPGLDG